MKRTRKLPKTDSIRALARFWDRHDITDFESELEEMKDPVFVRDAGAGRILHVPLKSREAGAVEKLARAKRISPQELVRRWVKEKVAPRRNGRG